MKNKILYLMLGVLFLTLTTCKKHEEPIRIGVNDWPPCELWYIAKEQGYFKDTQVEIIRFSTWADSLTAFYLGKIDLVSSSYINTLYYDEKGEKAKIILIAESIKGGDGLVVKNYIKNLKDLEGKKIAVELGTDEHFLLHKVLEKNGLNEDMVTIVPSTSKGSMEKFINGEVEACFTYEPYMSQAAINGGGRVAITTDEMPDYIMDVLIARNKVLEKKEKDYSNIIDAWYKAQKFVDGNRKKSYEMMSSKENVTPEKFKSLYERFEFFSLDESKKKLSSKRIEKKLMEIDTFLFETSLKTDRSKIEEMYTNKIIIDLGEE